MSDGTATRNVVMNLQIVADPGNAAVLSAMDSAVQATAAKMTSSWKMVADAQVAASQTAAATSNQATQTVAAQSTAVTSQIVQNQQQVVTASQSASNAMVQASSAANRLTTENINRAVEERIKAIEREKQARIAAQPGVEELAKHIPEYQTASPDAQAAIREQLTTKVIALAEKAAIAEEAASRKAEAAASAAYDREASAALNAYSRIMKEKEKQTEAAKRSEATKAAAAEKAYDVEVTAAVSAYSRIMRDKEKQSQSAKRAVEKEAVDAEKAYDKIASDAVRAYSRIMREKDKQQQASKQAAEKQAADAEAAYDKEASAALNAYSRIMRAKAQATKDAETQQAKVDSLTHAYNNQAYAADNMGRQVNRMAAASLQGVVGLAEGVAKLGILGEESTEALLRGLIQVSGGFQVVREGLTIYTNLSQMIAASTRATYLQTVAQTALNRANAAGAAIQVQHAAANSAVAATGMAATGAGAATGVAGGAAGGAGGTAGAETASAIGPILAAGAALAAIGYAATELIQGLTRLAGSTNSYSESVTGATFSLIKARNDAAESTKTVAQSEDFLAQKRKVAAERNQQVDARLGVANTARDMRSHLRDFRDAARNPDTTDPLAAARIRSQESLAEAKRAQERVEALDKQNAESAKAFPQQNVKKEQQRSWVGAAVDTLSVQGLNPSGYKPSDMLGLREDKPGDKEFANLGGVQADTESTKKASLDAQLKATQDRQKELEVARSLLETQKQITKATYEQARAASQATISAQQNMRSIKAQVGSFTKGEQDLGAKLIKRLQAGEQINRGEQQFLEHRGWGGNLIEQQRAKETEGSESAMVIAKANEKEKSQTDGLGHEGESPLVRAQNEEEEAINNLLAVRKREQEMSDEVVASLAAFNAQLETLPESMQKLLDVLNQKTGANESVDGAAAVGQAGEKLGASIDRAAETMIATLDMLDEKVDDLTRNIQARQMRGSLNQQTA